MGDKRPTNSELHLGRLEEEDSKLELERGILELFEEDSPPPDEDEPLKRDANS